MSAFLPLATELRTLLVVRFVPTTEVNTRHTAHYGRNATDKVSKTLVVRIKNKDKPVCVPKTLSELMT
jgi:prolyl-tRNA editing enzyme YbaK/EbsC (Cys-tRNA(Pro) deacylase)